MTYQSVKTDARTVYFFHCPRCKNNELDYSYLVTRAISENTAYVTDWLECDECLTRWDLKVYSDTRVELQQKENYPYVPAYVLLRSTNGGKPIFAMLHTQVRYRVLDSGKKDLDQVSYYYNEHTCPMNWIDKIVCLWFNGDDDPHGVFEFVDCITVEQARQRCKLAGEDFPAFESDISIDFLFGDKLNQGGEVIDVEDVSVKLT